MPFLRPIHEYRTIRALLGDAERLAHEAGEAEPGAEHLLLAALALPDGTARRAFERLGADPDGLPAAIEAQHLDALHAVGVDLGPGGGVDSPLPPARGPYRSSPSAQAAFRRAVELSAVPAPRRLQGAHVVAAVAELEHGTVPRALRRMGVEPVRLGAAARQEVTMARG